MIRVLLVLSGLVACFAAIAQNSPSERVATREEIVGVWQIDPLPADAQPKILKANPFPNCAWYSYEDSGSFKTIEKTSGTCEARSPTDLARTFAADDGPLLWEYYASPVSGKTLLLVKMKGMGDAAEYWEPHYVTKPFNTGLIQVNEGDLLLYFVNMRIGQVSWIRLLRRVQ